MARVHLSQNSSNPTTNYLKTKTGWCSARNALEMTPNKTIHPMVSSFGESPKPAQSQDQDKGVGTPQRRARFECMSSDLSDQAHPVRSACRFWFRHAASAVDDSDSGSRHLPAEWRALQGRAKSCGHVAI